MKKKTIKKESVIKKMEREHEKEGKTMKKLEKKAVSKTKKDCY